MFVKHISKRFAMLMLSGTFLLVACGTGPETETIVVTVEGEEVEVEVTRIVSAEPEEAEQVTLTLWSFGTSGEAFPDGVDVEGWWGRKIDEFEAFNPDITIEFLLKGREADGTTLFIDSAIAAGAAPDIYLDVVFREGKFAAQGLLEPVDAALTDEQWAALDQGQVAPLTNADGTHWGIPAVANAPFVLVVNKTIAERAGAADLVPQDPDRNWTTDEFEEFLRAVSDPPNRYGAGFYAKSPSFTEALVGYAGGFGAKFYTDSDYCNSTINSPEGVAWMEWWLSLIEEDLILPGPAALTDGDTDSAWANEQFAVYGWNTGAINLAQRLVDDGQLDAMDVTLVNYPHAPDQPAPGPAGNAGWAYTLFQQDDPARLDAAIQFLRFVGGQSFAEEFAGHRDALPVYSALMSNWAGDDTEKQFLISSIAANGLQDMGYGANNFNEVRLLNAEMRQAIFSGISSPQEGLDNFAEQANALLCG